MTTTEQITLFFAQNLLRPEDPLAWKRFKNRAKTALYRRENPEKVRGHDRKYYWKNPEKPRAKSREWRHDNPERSRDVKREYNCKRRASDPGYRLLANLRSRIGGALKRGTKGVGTKKVLGMEIKEFRIYLQGQFLPGMTWENYGTVWEIDHIRPCASFNLADPAQQRECFNWSNCQPLFVEDNLRKGAHYVSVG